MASLLEQNRQLHTDFISEKYQINIDQIVKELRTNYANSEGDPNLKEQLEILLQKAAADEVRQEKADKNSGENKKNNDNKKAPESVAAADDVSSQGPLSAMPNTNKNNKNNNAVLYKSKFEDVYLPRLRNKNNAAPKPTESESAVPDMQGVNINDALVVGFCDDPMQYFAQEVAPYIMPWKPLKLVYTPHLAKEMSSRAVHDIRFTTEKYKMNPKTFPHILICQGWHYKRFLKDITKAAEEGPSPEGYPIDAWVDGLYWPSSAKFKTHSRKNRPFLIAASMEANGGGACDTYDLLLDTKNKPLLRGCPTLWTPMAMVGLSDSVLRKGRDLVKRSDFDAARILGAKSGFCAFLYQTCFKKFYSNFASVRVAFFDLLAKHYKTPDALGGCRKGKGSNLEWKDSQQRLNSKASYLDESVEWTSRYKFTICFENSRVPGYITEKIVNAILANTIPIYFGAPDVADYVNPERFILCEIDDGKIREFQRQSFKSNKEREDWAKSHLRGLEDCVRRVREVDGDDELYKHIISQPFLLGNKYEDSIFDPAYYGKRIRHALELHGSDVLDL